MADNKAGDSGREGKRALDTASGMVTGPNPGKEAPPQMRHVYGPRPLGALIPGIARPGLRKRSPAAAQLMADWPAIVGPSLARLTHPKKLVGGRLTIACTGPVAMELQYLAPQLIGRINSHLGAVIVERLGFAQAPMPDVASPARPTPTQETCRRVDHAVGLLPEGELRTALAALGRAVLTFRSGSVTPTSTADAQKS